MRSTFRVVAAVLAVGLLALAALPAAAQSVAPPSATPEEKAAAIVRPSVVYLEQEWTAWVKIPRNSSLYFGGYVNGGSPFTWTTRCSGFIVDPNGYVVTAGHCVDPGEEGARETALMFAVQWLIDNGWAYRRDFGYWLNEAHLSWGVEGREKGAPADLAAWVQRGVAAGGLRTGEAFPARVVDYQSWSDGDVALLKIEETDLPSILVAETDEIDIGTPVLSVGYPGSTDQVTDATYEPTFKDGQINSQKTREGGLLPVYEMSAALSGGMSGGPTVNLQGAVVGINSFNIVGETEAFNFITPASLVREMLAANGVTNQLGPIDEAYRAGVEAFYAGDYTTAVERFDEVLGLSPTHQQAQELKVEATKLKATMREPKKKPADEGGGGGFPMWAIALVAAVLVAGGVVAFALSRRKRPPAAQVIPLAQSPAEQEAVEQAPVNAIGFQPPAAAQAGTGAPRASAEHFCSHCGHQLGADARFCAGCGSAVA